MGKKSKAPPPPDYSGLAKEQATLNNNAATQNTWADRIDQTNPYGSMTYSSQAVIDPATGQPVTKWSQNTTLNPELQRALTASQGTQANQAELAQRMGGQLAGTLSQPMSTAGMQGWGTGPQAGNLQAGNLQAGNLQATTNPGSWGDVNAQDIDTSRMGGYGDYRQRAEDAIYKSATSRLDPQWQQRESDMETQLANRGITRNSAAFEREMKNMSMQRNDAYDQARTSAITGGGAEAERNFGMDRSARDQQLSAQGARFGQDLQSGQFGLYGQNQEFNQAQQAGSQNFDQQQRSGAQNFGQQQQAGDQNFNQRLQEAIYSNSLRGQQFGEARDLRNQGINEYSAMVNGSQVQMPQFGSYNDAANMQGANVYGAAQDSYGAAKDAAQMKAANKAQTLQTVGTVAATMF